MNYLSVKNYSDYSVMERVFAVFYAASGTVWAYFQPIHHLIRATLIIIFLNIIVEIVKEYKGYRYRKKKRKKFDFSRWYKSFNFSRILLEPAIAVFILACLCVMYKELIQEDESHIYLDAAKWFTYIITVSYFLLFLVRIEELFPDFFMTKIIKFIYDKVVRIFNGTLKLNEDEKKELENIVEGEKAKGDGNPSN